MEESFIKTAITTTLDDKLFISLISYVAGIASSVFIYRVNDRYKRKNDLKELVSPSIIFLEKNKNFTGTKINLEEIHKVKNLLSCHDKNKFDELTALTHSYNLMPRHDSQKSLVALRSFHAGQIVPAIEKTINCLKKYE